MNNNKCWFQNWFNSKYYHLLYQHRDSNEASLFINELVRFFNPQPHQKFWDLCCGKGRHSLYINSKGFDVTGTDLSFESIQFASQYESESLRFYQHDMRTPFVSNYFDFVFNLFTSFGYFDNKRDDLKVFSVVKNALKKDGLFVLDYLNTTKAIQQLIPLEEKCIEGIRFSISKKIENNFIIKQIEVDNNGEKFQFHEKVKLLSLDDFKLLGEKAGFQLLNVFGDYTLTKFAAESSDRLMLIYKKQ